MMATKDMTAKTKSTNACRRPVSEVKIWTWDSYREIKVNPGSQLEVVLVNFRRFIAQCT